MNNELRVTRKGKRLCLLLAVFYLPVFFYNLASAQTVNFTTNLGNYPGEVYTVTRLVNLIGSLTCYLIQFALIAVGAAFVIYGIMLLMSRGEVQGFSRSKKALTWGVVGGLVIFSVFTIVLTVASLVGVSYRILTIVRC